VIVPRSVVVLVVAVVLVVVGAVVVVVEAVVVGLVLVAVVVELVVGSVVVEELEDVVELVVVSSPLSAATTASATPRPITAATRRPINAFIPPLIPPRGGSPYGWPRSGGGTSIRRVGSSCMARAV
jgi:hypothetical protein